MNQKDIERFWSKVDRSGGPDACWPWLGGTDKDGYGKFQTGGKGNQVHWRSHRFALLASGRDAGVLAKHSCDNPPCCNPAHLGAGTQLENRRECVDRGRVARGSGHGRSTLTEDLVREIRRRAALGESGRSIARSLSVGKASVYNVLEGYTWTWLR